MKEVSQDVCSLMKNELVSFRYLSEEDLPVLAPFFSCWQAQEGEVLWREGDSCEYLVILIEGKVDVKKETEFPGKQVIVGVYGKGSVIGELCILDQSPRAVTAVVLEDSGLLLLTRDKFERLLAENPVLGTKLLKGMLLAVSTRLRKSFDRLAAIF